MALKLPQFRRHAGSAWFANLAWYFCDQAFSEISETVSRRET